jgi:methylmalonyl-CoA mutase N-terminal domain/subunit
MATARILDWVQVPEMHQVALRFKTILSVSRLPRTKAPSMAAPDFASRMMTQSPGAVPDRAEPATTVSGVPIDRLYTPRNLEQLDVRPGIQLGEPGQYPFTRGIHSTMYRGRLWTVRMFAGFGTPRQTNQRFHFLLKQGQTGLSTAFDLPTLMGLDSDNPRAAGEVGRLGVAVDTVDDIHELFAGVDLETTSVSMTINSPAIVIMAFFLVHAEESGFDWRKLRGTIQNDILKEFHAQNEYVFPPEPSVRLVVDLIEFCTTHVPRWNTVSISGYHIREAGSTAVQELAMTLADGMHYVEQCLARGMSVDSFASRLSFFFNAHNDLFEEIAKYRAARALWADLMQNRYQAREESSLKLRFHAQTAGCSLQDRQPEVNLIRVAYQALAAVLGGCQSLHTNSMDETLSLPSEHAVTLAVRTQQVLAYETGVPNTVDPLGGSYFVETLTAQMRREAEAYFEKIRLQGGMIRAIEAGFFRREIAESAFAWQQAVDNRQKIVVGVNAFEESSEQPCELHQVDAGVEQDQIEKLRRSRERRNAGDWRAALAELKTVAAQNRNVLPALLQAARARATVGEIMDALADVFGRYAPGGDSGC